MCGIFGYVGKNNASQMIMEGLKRLEYRGYDSWGVAVAKDGSIDVVKHVGAIGDLAAVSSLPLSHIGIGHTRWATHGGVTNYNAHPHYSTDKSFVLAQNGIVENYQELKKMLLEKGYVFESETDTEVIVRLVEEKLKIGAKSLFEAVRMAFLDLHGRNTIILLASNGSEVVTVRNGSPLVVGVAGPVEGGREGEFFFASDTLSFADKTDKVIFLEDYQMVHSTGGDIKVFDVRSGQEIEFEIQQLDHDDVTVDKEGYEHFMLKEIVEQKHTVREAVQYSIEELEPIVKAIKSARRVYTVGAGTAGFAAGQIAYYLRKIAKVEAIELKSYEFDSYKDLFNADDLLIAVSQSGETADTIEALEAGKSKGAKIASIVNMLGSTITRMSDFKYFSRSGPEICVASTKAFSAQSCWGYVLASAVVGEYVSAKANVLDLSGKLESYFGEDLFGQVKNLVQQIMFKEHFFVLGKGQNFYIALEGALKVKEITYRHFEGFAAGELKHGVIALVDKGTPVFVIDSGDEFHNDILSAAAEVKARGAYVVGVGRENNELFDFFLPTLDVSGVSAIANVVPFQLISYFMGVALGNNPDKPRNLAKSVTVK